MKTGAETTNFEGSDSRIEREVGCAILCAQGFETNDEAVFMEPGDRE